MNIFFTAIRICLTAFSKLRRYVLDCFAFVSLRIYAIKVSFREVRAGRYGRRTHTNRNLDNAKDLDNLLATAKECYKAAIDRRTIITDKCKTLLALSSFILAISGLLLPKPSEVEGLCTRLLIFLDRLSVVGKQ